LFPTIKRPMAPYLERPRRLGSPRGGRVHAACDLYRSNAGEAVAIEDGQLLYNLNNFYQGPCELAILHDNGYVARYGEIYCNKRALKGGTGTRVKKGQIVGYIKRVNSGCCKPMLHFELYDAKKMAFAKG